MRKQLVAVLAFLAVAVVTAGAAWGVLGGQPDGNAHPYVGYEDNGVFACSGTLLSPTVMLTAAHCFSDSVSAYGNNTVTGAPIVRVSFDPNLINTPSGSRVWHFGDLLLRSAVRDRCGRGAPGVRHPRYRGDHLRLAGVPGACRGDRNKHLRPNLDPATYGALPPQGIVDTLKNGTLIDLVGYGDQNFIRGGGPCGGPCKPRQGDAFTRFFGQTTLISSNDRISSQFLKLHSNPSGTCLGDSGGPNLLGGTNVVLGINSFVANGICAGNTYSYRADTADALNWVTSTVSANGGSLSP